MAEYLDSTGLTYLCSKLDATYLKKADAVTIDTALSSSSTNPVQNKVINAALAGYLPFNNTYISNANSWLTNGYVKTSTTTSNLPSQCDWGILFFIAENAANGTGTQMYYPIDNTYKGRIFTRNMLNKTPGDWRLIPLASDFATVATSGSYSDLTDTPTIPTVPTTVSSFTNDAGYLTEHQSLAGYAKTEDLAAVATSGSYSDLSGTPTIPTVPTKVSAFTNDAGYLTSHQDISGKADKATTLAGYGITDAKISSGTITLGSNSITPLTSHQSLAAYAKTADLATVATSGSYSDLTNTPTIPDAVTVDTAMSPSSTNPVQNKVVYTAINDMLKGFMLNTMTNAISWRNGSQVGASITGTQYTGNAATATKATQDADGNVISSTYAKTASLASVATSGSYNDLSDTPTIPDTSSFAQTSAANTWSAWQKLQYIDIGVERYTTTIYSGTSHTPTTSDCIYTATGAFTLDMSTLAGQLDNSTSMVFSATFSASSDYTLTLTNAGTLKYLGSASDLAITSAGLLLNIKMCKDASGNLTSYVQGVTLSDS